MQPLPPGRTVWHITIGTYGSRLHGSNEPTVDRKHNTPGQPFVLRDDDRCNREQTIMRGPAVYLSREQRRTIQKQLPDICPRCGWNLHTCAAPPEPDNDHAHILLDADPAADPKTIRKLLKRLLSQTLDQSFPRPPGGAWWAVGRSTKPVKDIVYFNNVIRYINRQRTP